MSLEFYKVTTPKAKKPHVCEMCGKEIVAGGTYVRQSGKYNGEMFSRCLHTDCASVMNEYLSDVGSNEFTYESISDWWKEMYCYGCKHAHKQCNIEECTNDNPNRCLWRFEDGTCGYSIGCSDMTKGCWCDKYEETC